MISTALALAGNAVGLLVAAAVLDKMEISGAAFIIAVAIFTLVDAVIQPFLIQMAAKRVAALRGATALAATLISLIVTALLSDGLAITGLATWFWATLIVWLASLLAGLILPVIFVRNKVQEARGQA
jgi:putative membrane protein